MSPSSGLQSKRSRRLRIGAGLALGVLALGLGIGECAARRCIPMPVVPLGQFTPSIDTAHPDWRLRYVLQPGANATITYPASAQGPDFAVDYRVNALGMRDVERVLEKPNGALRIALLGDSITFGLGVPREQTFAALLETSLRARLADDAIEVWNFGVYGYDTVQELAQLELAAAPAEPDLAVVVFFLNDLVPTYYENAGSSPATTWIRRLGLSASDPGTWKRPISKLMRGLRAVSHLARVASAGAFLQLRKKAVEGIMRDQFDPRCNGWREFEVALALMQDLARRKGIELHVALHPYLLAMDGSYDWVEEEAQVMDLCRRMGLPCHDFRERYPDQDRRKWYVHQSDTHPNAAAHALYAGFLEEVLAPRAAALREIRSR